MEKKKTITKNAFKKFQGHQFFRAFILSQPLGLFVALLSLCIAIGLASTEKISSVSVVLELLFSCWPNDLH